MVKISNFLPIERILFNNLPNLPTTKIHSGDFSFWVSSLCSCQSLLVSQIQLIWEMNPSQLLERENLWQHLILDECYWLHIRSLGHLTVWNSSIQVETRTAWLSLQWQQDRRPPIFLQTHFQTFESTRVYATYGRWTLENRAAGDPNLVPQTKAHHPVDANQQCNGWPEREKVVHHPGTTFVVVWHQIVLELLCLCLRCWKFEDIYFNVDG